MAFKFIALFALVAVATASPVLLETDSPAKYDFSYSVHDTQTGDIKQQQEVRDGDNVQGSYSLVDADGLHRIVDYTADEVNGFQATVRREPITRPLEPITPIVHKVSHVVAAPVVHKSLAAAPVTHYSAAPVTHYSAAPVAHYTAAPVAHYTAAPVAHYTAAPVAHYAPSPIVYTNHGAPAAVTKVTQHYAAAAPQHATTIYTHAAPVATAHYAAPTVYAAHAQPAVYASAPVAHYGQYHY